MVISWIPNKIELFFLRLKIVGENTAISLPISKTDMRFFPFQFRGCELGYEEGFVSKVEVENCSKIITLQSMVMFKNYYPTAVKELNIYIYYLTGLSRLFDHEKFVKISKAIILRQ